MKVRLNCLGLVIAIMAATLTGCGDDKPNKPTGTTPASDKGKGAGAGGLKELPRQ